MIKFAWKSQNVLTSKNVAIKVVHQGFGPHKNRKGGTPIHTHTRLNKSRLYRIIKDIDMRQRNIIRDLPSKPILFAVPAQILMLITLMKLMVLIAAAHNSECLQISISACSPSQRRH